MIFTGKYIYSDQRWVKDFFILYEYDSNITSLCQYIGITQVRVAKVLGSYCSSLLSSFYSPYLQPQLPLFMYSSLDPSLGSDPDPGEK